jgi:hypothetical protein
MKYKELWEQMCQRCDELDKKLANQEQPPIGFITNARHRLNFEPNATGLKDMPKTVDWKIPVYASPQPKREWVGLTDEEMLECNMDGDFMIDRETSKRNVEAKLKEKNT